MSLCNQFNFELSTCTQVDVSFDWTKTLTYQDTSGVAIDVTSYVFVMTIKDENGGATLLSLPIVGDNLTTGIYIPVPTNGILNLQITDTDAGIVGGGVFPYELAVTDPDGLISPFMQGTIQFLDRGY